MSNDNPALIKAFVKQEHKNAFKAACALQGRSMNDVIEELLHGYVREVHTNLLATPNNSLLTKSLEEVAT